MRKRQRPDEPESLKKNAKKWAKKLLKEIKQQGAYAKVESKYK